MSRNEQSRTITPNDPAEVRDDDFDPSLLADLKVAGSLEASVLNCIVDAIRDAIGMLNGPRVSRLVRRCIPNDAPTADAISRLIFNITPQRKDEILEELGQWRMAFEARQASLPMELYEKIRRNLDHLIQDERASRLLHKSRRLQRDTGNELNSVKCICDVRPVFDDEHSSIEGFVSLINFQLGYQKQNQQFDYLELSLTEDELQYIVDKAVDALEKLQLLREAMSKSDEEENLQ